MQHVTLLIFIGCVCCLRGNVPFDRALPVVLLVGVVLAAFWAPRVVAAQSDLSAPSEQLASEYDQERLGAWLEHTSNQARGQRRFLGTSLTVLGPIAMTAGILIYATSAAPSGVERALGAGLIVAGGLNTSLGIVGLAKKSDGELLFERWLAVNKSRLTLRELGQFEGEFRSAAMRARRAVLVGRWTSLGLALTGGLVLGLTPLADFGGGSRSTGYASGGIALGVGLLGFAVSFGAPDETENWNAYQQGKDRRRLARGKPPP